LTIFVIYLSYFHTTSAQQNNTFFFGEPLNFTASAKPFGFTFDNLNPLSSEFQLIFQANANTSITFFGLNFSETLQELKNEGFTSFPNGISPFTGFTFEYFLDSLFKTCASFIFLVNSTSSFNANVTIPMSVNKNFKYGLLYWSQPFASFAWIDGFFPLEMPNAMSVNLENQGLYVIAVTDENVDLPALFGTTATITPTPTTYQFPDATQINISSLVATSFITIFNAYNPSNILPPPEKMIQNQFISVILNKEAEVTATITFSYALSFAFSYKTIIYSIGFLNDTAEEWIYPPGSVDDRPNFKVSLNVNHFSTYGLFAENNGKQLIILWGLIIFLIFAILL